MTGVKQAPEWIEKRKLFGERNGMFGKHHSEKAKKEKREFYIPRLNRERSLYGTEFEIKLRNELTQKAIAKECAEWIRKKVTFKSNISDKTIQGGIVVDDVGYTPINNFTTVELGL